MMGLNLRALIFHRNNKKRREALCIQIGLFLSSPITQQSFPINLLVCTDYCIYVLESTQDCFEGKMAKLTNLLKIYKLEVFMKFHEPIFHLTKELREIDFKFDSTKNKPDSYFNRQYPMFTYEKFLRRLMPFVVKVIMHVLTLS